MRISIYGCTGRVGRELVKYIIDHNYNLFAAIAREGNEYIRRDVAELINYKDFGIIITDDIKSIKGSDCVIDFSNPTASITLARYAADIRLPHIIGTTGFSEEQTKDLQNIAIDNKIFISYNMSFGINLINRILIKAIKYLNDDFDIDIIETHHKHKVDKPSGTALMFLESINNKVAECHSIRTGAVYGEHEIIFANESEMISFKHTALNREIFAKNSIIIAKWLINQNNGLYHINDFMRLDL